MDTYMEHIIKQKHSLKSILIILLTFILASVLSVATFIFSFIEPLVMQFSFALIVLFFFGFWWVCQKFSIEYEYILTNDEIDVDRITGKRSRKRMVTVSCKKFEKFGIAEGYEFEKIMKDKSYRIKFDASIGKGSYNRYYAVFCNKNGVDMVLIFNPTSEMLKKFRLFNPQIVKYEE